MDLPIDGRKILPVYLDAPGFKMINMKTGPVWPADLGKSGRAVIHFKRGKDGGDDHLMVHVDHKKILDWKGDIGKFLQGNTESHPDHPGAPITSLYSHEGGYLVSSWKLRVLDGEAERLR